MPLHNSCRPSWPASWPAVPVPDSRKLCFARRLWLRSEVGPCTSDVAWGVQQNFHIAAMRVSLRSLYLILRSLYLILLCTCRRRAKKAIGLAVPVTATPRRKSYRSTAYDERPKVEKPEAGAAAAARRVIADSDDEWPLGVRPSQAGTSVPSLHCTAGAHIVRCRLC